MSGYAVYENGVLRRAVFINLNAWLVSSQGTRPSVHINLNLSPTAGASSGNGENADTTVIAQKQDGVQGRRLAIQHADDLANLTWAGQSYETSNAAPTGPLHVEDIDIAAGFDLSSTEAILISFS